MLLQPSSEKEKHLMSTGAKINKKTSLFYSRPPAHRLAFDSRPDPGRQF